jgi:signal transduction histidine kinase
VQATVTEPTTDEWAVAARLRSWLPRGQTLDDRAFAERHRTLSILLALHVPALFFFGLAMGQPALHALGEVALAALLVGLAQARQVPRRVQGILVSAGLVWCSAVLVHFSGGLIEAHFHFFIILGFIALYQDWAAFGWAIVFTALSHGLGSTLAPDLMFNHTAAVDRPWTWALIHAGAVLFAATGQIIGWRHAEAAQDRATHLNTQLIREQAERQASYSRIYVNLARRNQSLLHRQIAVIDELERTEEDPETLRRLFTLDHLTTRIRRNAESLLVMAGEGSPRQVSSSVPVADVVRAAASEIEQYTRVDIRVADPFEVVGPAVVDVTHMLAELVENAAEYSSPETHVTVVSEPTAEGVAVVIVDRGIGMSPGDLAGANATLASPPELDDQIVRHLGFQVVGRLAAKLGAVVHLQPTEGGGITSVVQLPATLLAAPPAPVAPPAEATPPPAPLQLSPAVTPAAPVVRPATTVHPDALAAFDALDAFDAAVTTAGPAAAPVEDPVPTAAAPPVSPPPVPSPTEPAVPAAPVAVSVAAPVAAPVVPDLDAADHRLLFSASKPPVSPGAPVAPVEVAAAPPTPSPATNGDAPAQVPPPLFAAPTPVAPTPVAAAPTEPVAPTVPVTSPATATATVTTSSGLPRRTPAASLSPQLRQPVTPDQAPVAGAPPAEARRALSAFQSATRAGRDPHGTTDGEVTP